MTALPAPSSDRLLNLLADRATQPLSAPEALELDALLCTGAADPDGLDLAAAAIHLALLTAHAEPLPAALAAGLAAIGIAWSAAAGRGPGMDA